MLWSLPTDCLGHASIRRQEESKVIMIAAITTYSHGPRCGTRVTMSAQVHEYELARDREGGISSHV